MGIEGFLHSLVSNVSTEGGVATGEDISATAEIDKINPCSENFVLIRVISPNRPVFEVALPRGKTVLRKEDVLVVDERVANALTKAGLVEKLRIC